MYSLSSYDQTRADVSKELLSCALGLSESDLCTIFKVSSEDVDLILGIGAISAKLYPVAQEKRELMKALFHVADCLGGHFKDAVEQAGPWLKNRVFEGKTGYQRLLSGDVAEVLSVATMSTRLRLS